MSNNQAVLPRFEANLLLRGKIECLTGMHIGGSKEKLEIGGVDSIVIRNPRNNYPYIPGSSIKGKMRHLLEYITGAVANPVGVTKEGEEDKFLGNVSKSKEIVRIFGIGAKEREDHPELKRIGLTRLVVRDAFPDKETVRMWENDLGSDANFTEYKAENTIDRLTSAANPRFIERIVEGSCFEFEMVYSVFQLEEDDFVDETNEDLKNLFTALRLLEGSAIGKSGSRGYGRIRLHFADPLWIKRKDYQEATDDWKKSHQPIGESLKTMDQLKIEEIYYKA